MENTNKHLNPISYLKESKEELKKVTWPSKKDAIRYSTIVVGVTIGLAVFFTVIDWALSLGLDQLVKLSS
ncbi:MAG: Preprotein translocase subunit E [Candidatus Uhrbacteria bacterium GW2011_GWE2_45_35]|uniref:Protein translocase subunit SecE n=1 Tax=Candidatus Uhrbacteria bacterium GW2011_GWE2_45_35 TaxID=1618993 RepID=A0A0G1ML32_9BACT|nr:MAG: Preprotein translocase subunit E [Candidatus Uhrbacteria bacterium GW2011_GWE2_45_35]HBR80963.1 preprotein translocase subunit SecE [Candidatus Uhrbacteria bacterium]HCU31912.1 preprotein translocase subunit SecE [Candidatus Uhrbacteria bacterium]